MSIQQEIDRYFYQCFSSFQRIEGENCVRVTMGCRDNIPVSDWAISGKVMSRENLISFARYFYNLGVKQGK